MKRQLIGKKILIPFVFLLLVACVYFLRAGFLTDSQKSSTPETLNPKNIATNDTHNITEAGDETTMETSNATPPNDNIQFGSNPQMNKQLNQIADTYRENSRFPPYSKPLNKNDWSLLNPQPFIPIESAVEELDGVSATIQLQRYVHDKSIDLPVMVTVKGQQQDIQTSAKIEVFLKNSSQSSSPVSLSSSGQTDGQKKYQGVIAADELQSLDSGETSIYARLNFNNGDKTTISSVIKLYDGEAYLSSIGEAYVDGVHLVIPVEFDVITPGYYRLSANLFDETGENPVAHLNDTFQLNENENTGLLKVHATTLRVQNVQGPYLLRDFALDRRSSRPGEKTGYGSSAIVSAMVPAFDLDSFTHEEYVDPMSEKREQFLRSAFD